MKENNNMIKIINKTWKDFYKFPLMIDEYCGNVLAQPDSSGYMMAWDWIDNDWISEYPVGGQRGEALAVAIVKYVNGESEYRPDFSWSISPDDITIIQMNGQDCIEVRGFGNLNSTLVNYEAAAKVQDGFIAWLVNKLNGVENEE